MFERRRKESLVVSVRDYIFTDSAGRPLSQALPYITVCTAMWLVAASTYGRSSVLIARRSSIAQ
jgi:hypothetical protein